MLHNEQVMGGNLILVGTCRQLANYIMVSSAAPSYGFLWNDCGGEGCREGYFVI